MNYSEFVQTYQRALNENPEWRPGQTLFNVLHRARPELAEEIRGTWRDPFYDDSRTTKCWEYLAVMW